jgi:hypothetical protein
MDPHSSPSITDVWPGYFQIAANAINNTLQEEQQGFQFGFSVAQGLMPGTSPSIAAIGGPGENSVIAFQDSAGMLDYFNSASARMATGLPMMAGTSPSISATGSSSDWEIAYQNNNGSVAVYGTLGQGTLSLGMLSGTSPSITGLAGGGYQIAFQANTTALWITGSDGTRSLNLGMAPGTSPSITAIP